MKKSEFFEELVKNANQYDEENSWFGFRDGGNCVWSKGTWLQFIISAWKLYANASVGGDARMTILGDTKIRSDPKMIFNFGLVANAAQPQDDDDKKMVEEQMRLRNALSTDDLTKAIPILGSGGILSAERWSPALNDSLMLAGIENKQEFHLGLNVDEQVAWQKMTEKYIIGLAEFGKRRDNFGSAVGSAPKAQLTYVQELWLRFLVDNPRILWENGSPRVFARELMGLKLFGYKAQFDVNQLSFCWVGGGQSPTFKNYLDGLKGIEFHKANQKMLLENLSEFLFGHSGYLANPALAGVTPKAGSI